MPPTDHLDFTLAARYAAVPDHADRVMTALPPWARGPLCRAALAETLANAILHGVFALPCEARESDDLEAWLDLVDRADAAATEADRVRVTIDVGVDVCTVEVSDGGPGFDWRSTPVRPSRGLSIVRAAFEEVTWNDAGNSVRLTTRRAAP
jgi:Histidine kinase-like ATPase domain